MNTVETGRNLTHNKPILPELPSQTLHLQRKEIPGCTYPQRGGLSCTTGLVPVLVKKEHIDERMNKGIQGMFEKH